jgi:hypothetical protein
LCFRLFWQITICDRRGAGKDWQGE